MRRFGFFGLVAAVVVLTAGLTTGLTARSGRALAEVKYLIIGTGGPTGVYYPTGRIISRMVNRSSADHDLRLVVESTPGSVFNLNGVLKGDLDLGVVQSDLQYQAWKGLAEWRKSGPQAGLRSIFSIHSETFFLVAAGDSSIRAYVDLKGKSVAVGAPGSGQRQNLIDILAEYGLTHDDFALAEPAPAAESPRMLSQGRVDAFVYTVGNPAKMITEATQGRRPVRFVPVDSDRLAALIERHPYYVRADIPIAFYRRALNKKDVPTFAVKATLVCRADLPVENVYRITKAVFENFEAFKAGHPAFSTLTKAQMLQGLTAPLHPGALKYYREAGLK